MQKLKNKMKKQGGFTLVEMLIVVAIIAILIAVSIPLVSSSMDKTRHATDAANERAAKAEIMLQFLAGDEAKYKGDDGTLKTQPFDATKDYYYDAKEGVLSIQAPTTSYGQCEKGKHVGSYLKVKIDSDGIVTMEWAGASGVEKDLCGDAKNAAHTS